jgi:hypothetical protein
MTNPRVAVRFSENALEPAIRQVALLAHGADNNATGGPAFNALFPNGLDAELRPIGPSQVAAAAALRERLDTQPAAAKVKAQVMDSFDKALCLRQQHRRDQADVPARPRPARPEQGRNRHQPRAEQWRKQGHPDPTHTQTQGTRTKGQGRGRGRTGPRPRGRSRKRPRRPFVAPLGANAGHGKGALSEVAVPAPPTPPTPATDTKSK